MSNDMKDVPRRLRRFYRHGEPIPEDASNPVKEGENHEENEPWMNTPPASAEQPSRGKRNERRENARASAPAFASPSSNSKPGLFSRVLHGTSKPAVTPMDRALGLHDKEKFVEQTPNMSHEAMRQTPPSSDIQKTLQELRTLAKDENASPAEKKSSVSLTSFHFTPAGEAPRAPEANEKITQYSPENASANLSPRERAEQRRQGRATPSSPANPVQSTPSSRAALAEEESAQPAHIRRRMGRIETNSTLPMSAREDSTGDKDIFSPKDGEDFKDLFGDAKPGEKKKKKKNDDDDDLDSDSEELKLFEDEK